MLLFNWAGAGLMQCGPDDSHEIDTNFVVGISKRAGVDSGAASVTTYLDAQRPDAICRQTQQQPGFVCYQLGCDGSNLTNAEALAKEGVCMGGDLAPAGAKVVPGIDGLVN